MNLPSPLQKPEPDRRPRAPRMAMSEGFFTRSMCRSECPITGTRFLTLIVVVACIAFAACGYSTAKLLAKGEDYLAKRKFHDALMQFKAAVESDGNSAAAHWGMARSLENLGQFNDALDELRKTVDLDGSNLQAKAKLGNYYLLVKPPLISEAEQLQKEIVAADPNFVEGHILEASILAVQDRPENEVVAKINEAIAIDPTRTETYISLSRYYISKNKTAEAEEALKRGIAAAPSRAVGLIEYGRFLTYADRLNEAEAQFTRAIEVEPNDIEAHEAIAEHFVATKQYDRAEAEYRTLITIQDNSPESRLDLAEFFVRVKRTDEAIDVLNDVIANAPEYARARYRLAQIYLDRKDPAKVTEQLTELFKINNNDTEAFLIRARLNLQESKPDAAIGDLESILKKLPSHRDALYYMAQAKTAIGQYDQARAFIADIERYHPNYLRSGILKIQVELSSGNPTGALKMANELLAKVDAATPNADTGAGVLADLQVKALTARGLAEIDLKKLDEAQADLERVLVLTPDSSNAMVNLGRLFAAKREYAKALDQYSKALTADASNFDAISGFVAASVKLKQPQQAHSKIAAQLDANMGRADVLAALHYLNATVFAAEGNTAQQEAELLQSMSLDANYLPAYSAYASILAAKGSIPEAIAQYEAIIVKTPSAPVYTLLGILEDSRGNTAAAEGNYRKALDLDPQSPIAMNNLAWLLTENQGNLDEALQLASGSVAKSPETAGFYDTLGWVYYKKGLYSPAVEQLKKAVAFDERSGQTANPAYRVRLASALAASGDKASARREAEASLHYEAKLTEQEVSDAKRVLASL